MLRPILTVLTMGLLQGSTMMILPINGSNLTEYNRTVEEGNSTTFECDSSAVSPFYYYRYFAKSINLSAVLADVIADDPNHIWPWAVYAVNISDSNTRIIPNFVVRSEYALTINLTVEFHNNLICCQGYSGRQSISSTICYHVNVQFSPRLQSSGLNHGQWLVPFHPSYDEEVVMSCPLEGNPPASYQWYFEQLQDGGSYSHRVPIQPGNYLNITLLNKNRTLLFRKIEEEHNGYYTCNAENFLGSDKQYFHTKVQKCTPFKIPQPSVTINASPNLVAYVGNDLEIDCVVASWSQADSNYARWLRNEDEIDFEDSSSSATHIFYTKSEFDKDHCSQFMTLNIRKLTFKDSGNYSCAATVNAYPMVIKTMLLTVTVPMKQPNYKSLILKISIPVSVFIIILAISVVLGTYYYQRKCQMKLQKALEEYQKRPLPKKDGYQYEFFFAMTEEDEDKLKVDKLYTVLKQSFSIYYHLDQYLPGRTKVEMVTEGIKNSRFIILMLSKAYLQQKDEVTRLELMYTLNRIGEEFTKCAFIVTLEDNLHIPYKLRHIMKFNKEGADVKLRDLALSSDIYEPDSIASEDTELVDDDGMELELLNN